MNTINAKTGLETPLLSEEQEGLVEIVDDEIDEEEGSPVLLEFGTSCWDYVCILFVVPGLLLLQFVIAFHSGKPSDLTLSSVLLTIVLFTAASFMYKCCLGDHDFSEQSLVVRQITLLLPEILMDVVLGIVLFGPASSAFEALLYCTMLLAIFVITSTISTLRTECFGEDGDDDHDDEAYVAV